MKQFNHFGLASPHFSCYHPPDNMERNYEIMLILSAELPESKDYGKKFSALIQTFEGKVSKEDFWGEKYFKYPIKKQKKGIYTVIWFTLSADKVKELERKLKLDKGVVRYMITQNPNVKTQMSKEAQKSNV